MPLLTGLCRQAQDSNQAGTHPYRPPGPFNAITLAPVQPYAAFAFIAGEFAIVQLPLGSHIELTTACSIFLLLLLLLFLLLLLLPCVV